MTKTTILEKFQIIFETTMSSKMFIAVIAFIILLAVIALTTNNKNAKRGKSIYALVYVAIILGMLIMYHESLGKMFDYMMDNFFIVLYFPNIAVYMAAILITNIIIWTSVFNLKTPTLLRNINVIIYSIIHYLLALVLSIVSKNNLDIFSQTSIYGNKEAQAIIELSSGIFILWIIFLVFYKVIRHFQQKDEVPVKQKVVVKKVRTLPDGVVATEAPLYVKGQPKKEKPYLETHDETLANELVEQVNQEKQLLIQQLEDTKNRLFQAEEQLTYQQGQIKSTALEQEKFYQERLNFEESFSKLYDSKQQLIANEQAKLRQEQLLLQQEKEALLQTKARLQQEKAYLAQAKDTLQTEKNTLAREKEQLQVAKEQTKKVDTTTAIMQNLDGMLTLEDYKVLATILKEKQKRKNATKTVTDDQMKFNRLREAYKSAK